MASLSTDGTGNRTVQFVAADGKRRSLRLGKVNKKLAEGVKLKVEGLAAAARSGLPLDGDTAAWLARVGDDLHAKLHAVGLAPARSGGRLAVFLDGFIADRRAAGGKPATLDNFRTPANALTAFFGPDADLRAVTPAEAARFLADQQARLGRGTVHRRLKTVRQFFKTAAARGLVAADPFAGLACPNGLDKARQRYVTPEDTARLLAAADPGWRTAVALMRYGGLRCPTEVAGLRWADVDLAGGRMTVSSPKTEHLPDRAWRVVPVFAALRPYLDEAWELAADGAEFVVPWPALRAKAAGSPRGWKGVSLGTAFARLTRRAGLPPLPKPAVNLRGSCETDLMQDHPIHVVTAWIGNTPKVAIGHYLQTLDRDFEKAIRGNSSDGAGAVQIPVQTGADSGGPGETSDGPEGGKPRRFPPRSARVYPGLVQGLRPGGLEPSTSRVEIDCSIQLSYGRVPSFCRIGRRSQGGFRPAPQHRPADRGVLRPVPPQSAGEHHHLFHRRRPAGPAAELRQGGRQVGVLAVDRHPAEGQVRGVRPRLPAVGTDRQ